MHGQLIGVGVGAGARGLVPVAAVEALRTAEVIYAPRARGVEQSVARQCLAGLGLDHAPFIDVEFLMDNDRRQLGNHYQTLAAEIATRIRAGQKVGYLTIGDSLTYSTYGYLLAALRALDPEIDIVTFAGVTSFAAAAAALEWPLGEGKERVLLLPCPDDRAALQADIETHDCVVLLKIGHRLPMVLDVLATMGISAHCGFAHRVGLDGEALHRDICGLDAEGLSGYLSTLLIRRHPREARGA